MAIDFPNSPSNGQVYTVGDKTWVYGDGKWQSNVGSSGPLNDLSDVTAPSPTSGDYLKWNGTEWVNDPINLGTDTTGAYVQSLVAGTNVAITNNSGEGATPTISITGNIGNFDSISTPDYVQFDTTLVNATPSAGALQWDSDFGTLSFGLTGNDTEVKVGFDNVAYCYNADSVTLTKGTPVYIFGGQGSQVSIKRAANTGDATSARTLGLVSESIAAGASGYVVTYGVLTGVDTSAYTVGQILYLGSTAGSLTTTTPYAPNHYVFIGVVIKADVGGEIWIRPQNGYELDEIHNVDNITNPPVSGDFLKYNGTLWVNDQINLGTDTVGNYMSDVSAGTGISVTHTPSEGSTGTVAIDTAVVPQLGATNTFSTNQIISGSTTADLLRITQTGTGNALVVEDSANPDSTPLVVDASGRTIIGHTASVATRIGATSVTAPFQVLGTTNATASSFISRSSNDVTGPNVFIGKSRATTIGGFTTVAAADQLGVISFAGADGTQMTEAARLTVLAEGTVSSGVVPGILTFSTASSAGTLTERMRIDSAGQVGIGATPSAGRNLTVGKALTGATTAFGMVINGGIQSDVTGAVQVYRSAVSTAAASFTLPSLTHFYVAGISTPGAGSAVTNQYGYLADSSLTGATNNYGFYGDIAAASGRWHLYMSGTAANYLAGRLGVGVTNTSGAMTIITNTTAADKVLVVKGAASQTGIPFEVQNSAGAATFYVGTTGNVIVANGTNTTARLEIGEGRTVDADSWLDLIGDTTYTDYGLRIVRSSGANGNSFVSHRGTGLLYLTAFDAGSVAIQTNSVTRMTVDPNGNIGIGSSTAAGYGILAGKNITGAVSSYGMVIQGQIQSDVTANAATFTSAVSTAAAAFTLGTLRHFTANNVTIGSTSAVTNQVGFYAGALTNATGNFGFYGDIASGTSRYNLYMNGTADNYLAGNTGIGGLPVANIKLHVAGNASDDANPEIRITGSGTSLDIFNNLGAGAYNNIVSAGSKGIIAIGVNSSTSRASFVIAPWSDVTYGIRFEGGATTNILQTGTTIFTPSATTSVASIIKGLASQTANLQQWQNSAGTVLAYVAADGSSSFYEGDQNILATSIFS